MNFFQFKGFELKNESSSFRINTDGVLLASWIELSESHRILEIGSGTGVISIIAKFRFPHIRITGIDIDSGSVEESRFNIHHNSLKDVEFLLCSCKEFNTANTDQFDHIVSNPPYFQNSTRSSSDVLAAAKHNSQLSFEDLIDTCKNQDSPECRLSIILPVAESDIFQRMMEVQGFNIIRELKVSGRKGHKFIRRLMEFKRGEHSLIESKEIHMYVDEKRTKSQAYAKMVSGLYI